MQVVRTEMGALSHLVGLGGGRKGRDRDRIGGLANIEHPHMLASVPLGVGDRLVGDNQEVAVGQRQGGLRAAAKGRRPVAMGDRRGFALSAMSRMASPPSRQQA